MGLFDFIKGELINVIEWTDDSTNNIVYKFPVRNAQIKMGAQLTVRQSQVAIFVNEGQIADVFTPGRYELTTANMPVLTTLKSWKYGFNSPFKAEVYFVNTKQFTNQKWGTSNPIMMRDQEFGMLRLRSYGIYSFKVEDPVILLNEAFGTNSSFNTEDITGHLKRVVISGLSDLLAESKIPAIDLAMYYDELSQKAKEKMDIKFKSFGLTLKSFIIENISLPEEVEKVMDKRTSMGVLGNLDKYTQYQAAEAIRDAAQNEGSGLSGAGVSLGAGAALGNIMTNAFNQKPGKSQDEVVTCSNCKTSVSKNSKFCNSCGTSMKPQSVPCVKCGVNIKQNSKFCAECGSPQDIEKHCSACGAKMKPSSKFCPECGQKAE